MLYGHLLRKSFRLLSILMAASFALGVAGCASLSGYPEPVVDPDSELAALQSSFASDTIKQYQGLADDNARRNFRDENVYGRMRAYDIAFRQFEKALSKEIGGTALSTDLVALALNGLGATVGDAETKAALSAASGGVLGAKGSVNKNLFYEKTLPAMFAQMEAQRLKVRATIEQGLATPVSQYPLSKALVDLELYLTAGSLPGAVSAITQDAGTTTQTAQQDIKAIARDASFTKQRPDFKAQQKRIAALTDAQALALAQTMEPFLTTRSPDLQTDLKAGDPQSKHLTDGAKARTYLLNWVATDERSAETLKQWTDAIDKAAQ